MDNYFKMWKEWKNIDFGSKSSTFIKGVENEEEWTTNQPINHSIKQINRLNVN